MARTWTMKGSRMIAVLVFFLAPSAWGPEITAGLRGTVTDPSGSVVPGAKVALKEVQTGYTREMTTNSTGGYDFTLLPVGTYDLSI